MIVHIKRQSKPDSEPYIQSFAYNGPRDITVAALLDYLNFNDDLIDIHGQRCQPIEWECSCLQKVCGSCAMIMNNRPALACGVFLQELKEDELTIAPLTVFPVIKDLRVDRSVIFQHLKEMELWITSISKPKKNEQTLQYDSAKCLKCGLCMEVCPNYTGNGSFYGASIVNETYLTYSQNADEETKKTIKKNFQKHFTASCSKSLSCAAICPVNMQPLSSIAWMNRKA